MGRLIGRDSQLASIEELLAQARASCSGTLLLEGPPGIGKTALLEAARDRGHGFLVVTGSGSEAETELPYGVLSQIFLPLEPYVGSLAPWQAEIVNAVLPGRDFAPRTVTDRFTVGAATLALVSAAAEHRPVLILIDDAHWVDAGSADALVFVHRRLVADRVAMVLGRRPGIGARSLRELPKLELDGLDLDSVREFLRCFAPEKVPDENVPDFASATGGNPLALRDLPRLLTREELQGMKPTSLPPPIRETLVHAYRGRLNLKQERVQLAALIAALMGPVKLPALIAALQEEGLTIADLAEAEENSPVSAGEDTSLDGEAKWLLRFLPDRVEFRHPLVRAAVRAGASLSMRRRAHAAIAAALEGSSDLNDVALRIWHRAEAVIGVDDDVAASMEKLAEQAAGASGFGSAAVAFERAAQLSSDGADQQRRYVKAAQAAYHAGWSDRAKQFLMLGTAREFSDVRLQQEAAEIGGELERSLGRPGEAYKILTNAAQKLATAGPAEASWLWLMSVESATFMGDMAGARRAIESARQLAGDRKDLHELADAGDGVVHILSGEPGDGLPLLAGWAKMMLDVLHVSEPDALLLQLATGVGFALSTVDELDLAESLLSAVVTKSISLGAAAALPMALSSRANIRYRRGDWIAAQADADWGLAVAESTGRKLDISGCLVINALLDASVGREQDLDSHLSRALPVLKSNDVATTLAQVYYMQGLFDLVSREPTKAITSFEKMRDLCESHGLGEVSHWQWPADLVEAYVRARRPALAPPALARLEAHADATGRPIVKALAARCRGLVALDGFQAEFEDALEWHDRASRPFENARTQLCYGERLRRAKQRAAARRQLEAARQTFARLGATAWAKFAQQELVATGVQMASSARSYTAELQPLTPQEREVAMAVASGATNDEAAARLFLSTKTVEYHLHKVYRKLHASRSTLAKALDASVADNHEADRCEPREQEAGKLLAGSIAAS